MAITKPRRQQIKDKKQEFEAVDNTPIEMPGNAGIRESFEDKMRKFIREEASRMAVDNDLGSFEEEDDFSDTQAEPEIMSEFELTPAQEDTEFGSQQPIEEPAPPETTEEAAPQEAPPEEGAV